jgi:hypothetical protein
MIIDYQLADDLRNLGYVTMPLLSPNDIWMLRKLFDETQYLCEIERGFYTSIWSKNKEYRSRVDNGLKQILMPRLDEVLQPCRPIFANFMVKHPGVNTGLQPHQDWSFVDELKFQSYTAWIPLADVTEENGAIQVFPKSHQLTNFIRPRFSEAPFKEYLRYIESHRMLSLPMKAGDVLMLNSRCIHSSPANNSEVTRLAVSVVIVPENAEVIHHVLDESAPDIAYGLNVDSDFFVSHSCFERPEGYRSGRTVTLHNHPLLVDEVMTLGRMS